MIDLNASYKLTNNNQDFEHLSDFKQGDYSFYDYQGKRHGIHFRCPGCGAIIAIEGADISPKWNINFETLTATPSIKHSRNGRGCGWHGYMTDGVLTPC